MGRNPANLSDPKSIRQLWLLTGFALLIRLWGIWYGLPFIYWTDEYHEVMRALELGAGEFNLSRTGKGGFYLLLFLEYGFYYGALKVSGIITTTREFAEQFVRDPSVFYLMGRATAALFGCATVAAVYCVARQANQNRAGVCAALFLAVNVVHIDLSHRVGVDVPMVFFATLALYFGGRIAADGRRKEYLLAGLCAALATTSKLPGILVLLPLVIAHTYRVAGTPGGRLRWLTSRDAWLAVAVFVLVLAVSNPGILLHFNYLSFYSPSDDGLLDDDVFPEGVLNSYGRPNLYLFYLNVLQDSMGWPLFALAVVGIGNALWKRKPVDVMLLSYGLINYLVIANTSSEILYYPRYALPIIVVLAVLAGRAASDFIAIVPRWRAAVWASAMVVLVAWPLSHSAITVHALTQTDTRTLARKWFDANVPAGSKVLIEGGKIAASRLTVPLEDSRESLERRIEYWKMKEPRQAKVLELKRAVHEGGGYDLELVRIASIAPFSDYTGRGIEYFVVRPEFFIGSRKAKGGSARLLNELHSDTRVELVKQFKARTSTRLGPTIDIYHFSPGVAPSSQ